MWFRALLVPVGVIVLLAVAGLAYAEDAPPAAMPGDAGASADEGMSDEGMNVGDEVGDEMNEAGTVESAMDEAPVYEEEYREDLRERYFRLTKDFINPQALGLGSVGRVPAWGSGVLRAGPFRYTPFLEASGGWESNVFLDEGDDNDPISRERNERSSWYWQIRTGVYGDAKFMQDKLTFRTVAEVLYRDYTRESAPGNWEGTFGLSARYSFPIGIWAEVGGTWYHLFDPIGEEDVPTRMERDQVDFSFDVGLDQAIQRVFGGKLKITVGADMSHTNFHKHEYSMGDRQEFSAYIKVAYNVIRELDAFIRYEHGWTNAGSHRLNDGFHDNIDVGVDGAYPITKSGRLLGTVFIGFRTDRFDDAEVYRVGSDRLTTDTNDKQDDLHAGAQLRWLLGTRTTVSALYVHSTEFSLTGNYQTVDRLDLSVNRIIIPALTARAAVYGEIDRPSAVGESFRYEPGGSTKVGRVYRYGAGLGARYALSDFVDVSLHYDATMRNDTDINGNDYINHQVELGLTFHLR